MKLAKQSICWKLDITAVDLNHLVIKNSFVMAKCSVFQIIKPQQNLYRNSSQRKCRLLLTFLWWLNLSNTTDEAWAAVCHSIKIVAHKIPQTEDFNLVLVSVRDGDTVKHYRIRQLDEGGFFIARRTTFRTLQELVQHYSNDADGLCVNLCKPCVQVRFIWTM